MTDKKITEKIKRLRKNIIESALKGPQHQTWVIKTSAYIEGLRDALGNEKVDLLIAKSTK